MRCLKVTKIYFNLRIFFVFCLLFSPLQSWASRPGFCKRAMARVLHHSGALALGLMTQPSYLRGIPSKGAHWGTDFLEGSWTLYLDGSSLYGQLTSGHATRDNLLLTIEPLMGSYAFRGAELGELALRRLVPQVKVQYSNDASPNKYMEYAYALVTLELKREDFKTQEEFKKAAREVYEFSIYGPRDLESLPRKNPLNFS